MIDVIGKERAIPNGLTNSFNENGHCRGTGVVELINGEWKIAHYALTMLVPNEIAAKIGLQTQAADEN